MLKNYIKTAFRNLRNQKGFSLINLSGLAIGMACCLLILLYVKDELSYDRHYKNSDRLYRVVIDGLFNEALNHYAVTPMAAPPVYSAEVPEIENFTRMFGFGRQQLLKIGDRSYEETGIFIADSSFFEIFSHEFIAGEEESAIKTPGSVVIAESAANKIFGNQDAMGQMLNFDLIGEVQVTGIVKDVPANSHFSFQYIVPFNSLSAQRREALQHWIRINGWAYILLSKGADIKSVERKIQDVWEKNTGEYSRSVGIQLDFMLQRVIDIHLHSNRQVEIESNGDNTQVIFFSAIAIFILFIACINFMNLSTARSARRAREVGLRKVFGAHKTNLIRQFLMETTVFSMIGLAIAIVIVLISLPIFNDLTGKGLTLSSLLNSPILFGMLGIVIFTGVFAGSYPAFFLSRFEPDRVLRGTLSQGMKGSILRKIFVVFQFSLSVMLIFSTGVILDQISFMKNKELGFKQDLIMVVNIKTGPVIQNPNPVKNELILNPNISYVSASTGVPGRVFELRFFVPEGSDSTQSHAMNVIRCNPDYISTFDMKIVAGRDFSNQIVTDISDAFLVNETGAQKLGWTPEEAVGKELEFMTVRKGHIVGVIKDFHFKSMREKIEPLVVMAQKGGFGFLVFRLSGKNVSETIDFVEKTWKKFEPEHEFSYFFVDEIFDVMYVSEERTSQIFSIFAFLAIFIASLGLFGLASYTAQQRTREIGIRKVLGASASRIILNLTTEFLKWVVVANFVAIPVAAIVLRKYWLASFPFHDGLPIWTFVLASGLSIVIAFVTVYYQSFKAATANPVNSIRNE